MRFPTTDGLRRARTTRTLLAALALTLLALLASAGEAAAAPSAVKAPRIKGKASDGKTLRATPGKWSGTPTFAYAWERCSAALEHCEAAGAGSTHPVTDADVGHRLRALVTATDTEGSASATSAPTATIAAVAPKKKQVPSVSGAAVDGQLLAASPGSWQGTGPIAFAYQWEACMKGSPCAPIAGATSSTYRAASSDIAHTLRVTVAASNMAGSASATSKPSAAVGAGAPVALAGPSIAGTPVIEQTLTAQPGEWAGTAPMSYGYQWLTCNLAEECEAIAGATGSNYTLQPLQIADSIEVEVTAANALGAAVATSEPTSIVKDLPPQNRELPSVAGLLRDGQLLSALPGSWSSNEALSFSYAWEVCDSAGLHCHEVSGDLGGTLAIISSMVGGTVRVVVTATNGSGSTSATSEPTNLIAALLPANSGLPSIGGLLQDGSSLLASLGSWTGTGPLSFSKVWELCDAAGANCAPIEGGLGDTLALIASMVGDTVRLAVTATNSAGSTTATSEPSDLIKGLLPSNTGLPSIGGLLQDGSSLLASLGSWSGSGPLSFSKVWELCDGAGEHCKALQGAVGDTLALVGSMVGDTVRLAVTASNSTGSTTATSEPTSLVKALLPSNLKLPSVGGELIDTKTLSALLGSWSGTSPSFSEQWELCNGKGEGCKALQGAVGTTLGLLTGEIGSTVRLAVTASNSAGSTTAYSEPTGAVGALLPSNLKLPGVGGELIDTKTLTGLLGSWSGSEPSFSQQWELCNAKGEACKAIEGAVGSTLGLLTGEIGATVRLAVTATNSAGSATAFSAPTSAIKALIPSNTKLPSISGLAEDGQTLAGALGSWAGSEPSLSESWELCNAKGESCKAIEGAVGGTLGLLSAMVGDTVRLAVTATNSAGSVTATSPPSSSILAILPRNTTAPSIAGLLKIGQTIEALTGKWAGSEPIKFGYQWQLCGLGLKESECSNVAGAVERLLKLELAWALGLTVRVVVTATNARGSSSAASPISIKIPLL